MILRAIQEWQRWELAPRRGTAFSALKRGSRASVRQIQFGNRLRWNWSIRYSLRFAIGATLRIPWRSQELQKLFKWSHSAEVTPSASTTPEDPHLTALRAYWTEKRGSRTMPQRADINPREIVPLLPHIMILEIQEPLRFCFRLVGTKICERCGKNHTGKWLDELDFDGSRALVLAQYGSVARTGVPQYAIDEFVNDEGRYLHYQRLLLPLSDDGLSPTMLLGMQKAIGVEGYQRSVPKWM